MSLDGEANVHQASVVFGPGDLESSSTVLQKDRSKVFCLLIHIDVDVVVVND